MSSPNPRRRPTTTPAATATAPATNAHQDANNHATTPAPNAPSAPLPPAATPPPTPHRDPPTTRALDTPDRAPVRLPDGVRVTDEDRALSARLRGAQTAREARALDAEMYRSFTNSPEGIAYQRFLTIHDPDYLRFAVERGNGKAPMVVEVEAETPAIVALALAELTPAGLRALALLTGIPLPVPTPSTPNEEPKRIARASGNGDYVNSRDAEPQSDPPPTPSKGRALF